jgi:hypothetical protein
MTPKSEGAKPKRKPRRGAPIVVTPLWSGGQCHIAGLVTISESNRRGHWRKHSDRTKNQRMVARSCTERIKVNFMPVALPAHFELTRIAPRALDDDNLRGALKAIRDGIADAMGASASATARSAVACVSTACLSARSWPPQRKRRRRCERPLQSRPR